MWVNHGFEVDRLACFPNVVLWVLGAVLEGEMPANRLETRIRRA